MNNILIKALAWLDRVANASSSFAHPQDKGRVEEMALALSDLGLSADELGSIKDYCRERLGWSGEASKVVTDAIKKALSRKASVRPQYFLTEELLEMWGVDEADLPSQDYLRGLHIDGLWGWRIIDWQDINEDVNVVVGVNGEGKTTLLNCIFAEASGKRCDDAKSVELQPGRGKLYPVAYLRSFDNPAIDKRRNESLLLQELNNVIYQNQSTKSFFDYRMQILDTKEESARVQIQKRIDDFFGIVNSYFADSHKRIEIKTDKAATIVFRDAVSGAFVPIDKLSAGEKQLLLVLFKVFLQEEKPYITLIDEPETSLHISWQRNLIDTLRQLNPKGQLLIATQSPSILSKGWMVKSVMMSKLIKE